jgi:ABC-type phosphate transport system permease subunit
MIFVDLTTIEELLFGMLLMGLIVGALSGIYLERWAVKRRR